MAEEQPGTHLGHRPPSSQDLQGRELQRLFVLESHGVARSPPGRGTGSSCGWSPAQRAVQELPGPRLRHCRALLLLPLSPLPCGGVHGQPSPPWPQPLLGASSGPSNHSDAEVPGSVLPAPWPPLWEPSLFRWRVDRAWYVPVLGPGHSRQHKTQTPTQNQAIDSAQLPILSSLIQQPLHPDFLEALGSAPCPGEVWRLELPRRFRCFCQPLKVG